MISFKFFDRKIAPIALPEITNREDNSRITQSRSQLRELIKSRLDENSSKAFDDHVVSDVYLNAVELQKRRPKILFSKFPPVGFKKNELDTEYEGIILNLEDVVDALNKTSKRDFGRVLFLCKQHLERNNFLAEIMQASPDVSVVRFGPSSAPYRFGANVLDPKGVYSASDLMKWPDKPISWWKIARHGRLDSFEAWEGRSGYEKFSSNIGELEANGYITADLTELDSIIFSDHNN